MEYVLVVLGIGLYTVLRFGLIRFLARFEKERIRVWLLIFIGGVVPGIILPGFVNQAVEDALGAVFGLDPLYAWFYKAVVFRPVAEELANASVLLVVFLLMRKKFRGVLDGIIYGAVVGLGFVTVDELFWMCRQLYESGTWGAEVHFVMQVVLLGMGQLVWTAFTGLGFGVAAAIRNRWFGALAVVLGLGAAVAGHATSNTLLSVPVLTQDPELFEAYYVADVLLQWSLLLVFLVIIVMAWFAQWRWIKDGLQREVSSGSVRKGDFRQASKWFGRLGWELRFLVAFDLAGFFRVRKLYNLLVKLAFARRDYERDPGEDTRRRLDDARRRAAELRAKFD